MLPPAAGTPAARNAPTHLLLADQHSETIHREGHKYRLPIPERPAISYESTRTERDTGIIHVGYRGYLPECVVHAPLLCRHHRVDRNICGRGSR